MFRIKQQRLRRGWNQVKLSCKADVPVSDISKIENGRALPYPAQRERLARVLQLDPDTLLDEVDVSPDIEVMKAAPARPRRRKRTKGTERAARQRRASAQPAA